MDIREQYPLLDRVQTEIIAAEIGVEHPSDPCTGENIVLTTDFLLKVKRGEDEFYIARTIKELDELNHVRQIQKFEIERRFWEFKGIDWGIVVAEEIPKVFAKNISDVRPFYKLIGMKGFENLNESQIGMLINEFKHFVHGEKLIVRKICKDFDNKLKLEAGSGIKIFKHLVWKKQILIDMQIPLSLDKLIEVKSSNNI